MFTGQAGVVEEGGMGGGMSCWLFQSHVIYILFPFQDPQNDEYSAPKRCRLATKKRPAYEPASGGPSPKRSAPCAGEELEWSPTDGEGYLNLVSPLLTSKVTVSVLGLGLGAHILVDGQITPFISTKPSVDASSPRPPPKPVTGVWKPVWCEK